MPSPTIYVNAKENPFADVPGELQTNTIDVLYATDRQPQAAKDDALRYGSDRSLSLAFGSCIVELGDNLTWDDLVQHSTTKRRTKSIAMSVASTSELGRFPPTPMLFTVDDSGVHEDPEVQARLREASGALCDQLRCRMAISPKKEVLIYVHGFNNTFEDAIFRAAELAHFLGREIVPIAYTWPAGASGLLKGYTRDRESGEFTIFHLKEFLRVVASCKEIEKIHVLAHSRGADVMSSALRELYIECRAAGQDFRRQYRIANAILAAADLDIEVAQQRLTAERIGLGVKRITLYVSQSDDAIGIAEWLYGSVRRIGRLRMKEYARFEKIAPKLKSAAIINARVKSDVIGHGYFHANPAVSSDLILILRYDRDPGATNGRPLKQLAELYWEIDDNYLKQ